RSTAARSLNPPANFPMGVRAPAAMTDGAMASLLFVDSSQSTAAAPPGPSKGRQRVVGGPSGLRGLQGDPLITGIQEAVVVGPRGYVLTPSRVLPFVRAVAGCDYGWSHGITPVRGLQPVYGRRAAGALEGPSEGRGRAVRTSGSPGRPPSPRPSGGRRRGSRS